MKIITGFETESLSDSPSEAKVINEDFIKVFKAIEHSLDVAENAFARAAKRAFKRYSDGGRFVEAKEARDMKPSWITEVTVVLPVKGYDEKTMASELQKLIVMLGEAFKSTTDEPAQISLIDPLKCHLRQVSDIDFKFTLKQMWAPNE